MNPWYVIADRQGRQNAREFRSLKAALKFVHEEMNEPRCVHQNSKVQVWVDDQDPELLVILRKVRINRV